METRYYEGSDIDFIVHIQSLPNERKEIVDVDGKSRWKVTEEDGTEYILRPASANV